MDWQPAERLWAVPNSSNVWASKTFKRLSSNPTKTRAPSGEAAIELANSPTCTGEPGTGSYPCCTSVLVTDGPVESPLALP
jgi:hypothetical protein